MAALVHAAQAVALERGADERRTSSGAIISAGQKPIQRRDLVGEVGAEHEDAGVREVEHAHHAEDQREARASA